MRAKLPHGEQREFINTILRVHGWTLAELAKRCGIGKTTLVKWRQEHHPMPVTILERLTALSGIPHPLILELIDDNEGRRKGGRISQQRRHEQPELYSNIQEFYKQVISPPISPKLAEFIGIMLGDGGITANQASITSNLQHEREYAAFVADLAADLFGVQAVITDRAHKGVSAINVVLSSTQLVERLQELGLVVGNKVEQQCAIPEWVFEDVELMRGCVRGLMDTDGCVYHHGYAINGKRYNYVKMTFASRSWPLMEGVQRIWRELGLTPGSVRKRGYISLSSNKEVRRYYEELVGTHNPYHWQRYCAAVEATK